MNINYNYLKFIPIISWYPAYVNAKEAKAAYLDIKQILSSERKESKDFYDRRRSDFIRCTSQAVLCAIPVFGNAVLMVYAIFNKVSILMNKSEHVSTEKYFILIEVQGKKRRIFNPDIIKDYQKTGVLKGFDESNEDSYWRPKELKKGMECCLIDIVERWGDKTMKELGWTTDNIQSFSEALTKGKIVMVAGRANCYYAGQAPRFQIPYTVIAKAISLSLPIELNYEFSIEWTKIRTQTENDEQAEKLFIEKLEDPGFTSLFVPK